MAESDTQALRIDREWIKRFTPPERRPPVGTQFSRTFSHLRIVTPLASFGLKTNRMPRPLHVQNAARRSTSSFGRPSSTLRSRLVLALGALACGLHCGGSIAPTDDSAADDASEDTDAVAVQGQTEQELTTKSGAELIVLPTAPSRTTRMFGENYVAPFVNAGWGATATPTTTAAAIGKASLAVKLESAWSAFGLGITWAEPRYDGRSQTEVRFWFNAGSTVRPGTNQLAVAVDDDDASTPERWVPLLSYLGQAQVAPNTWYRIVLPMSALNPTNLPIRRVLIGNRSTSRDITFFVDEFEMSWTDPSPKVTPVFTDANASTFTAGGWSVGVSQDAFCSDGSRALRASFNAPWGALTFVHDYAKPELPTTPFTRLVFDISPGPGTPSVAMNDLRIGLDTAPRRRLISSVPGGFRSNTWHRISLPVSELRSGSFRTITLKNETPNSYAFFIDRVRLESDNPPPPLRPGVPNAPDDFRAGEVDVVSTIKTSEERRPISPLIYGINAVSPKGLPADVLRATSFLRRGGDRANTYNWENNLSNGSHNNGFASDAYLARHLASPSTPGEVDRELIALNRAAGRGTMVSFTMHDFVAAVPASNLPFKTPGWNIAQYFHRVELVKPTAFASSPNLNDGVVYTDEHINFLATRFPTDIFAPGTGQVIVGTDNEPDLYDYAFPMLQRGTGRRLYVDGVEVGRQVTGDVFTQRFLTFARRVKSLWPNAPIVGPGHYQFDGFSSWRAVSNAYSGTGRWYMDDFLEAVRSASQSSGKRLLDTWDFHWYPQALVNGTPTWNLNAASRPMTAAEIDAVVQAPRSYWDKDYDEGSWITKDHLLGPAYILDRLESRIAQRYPGTRLGINEYFPGGCGHVSSGLATADSLGIFGRKGVHMAALWPVGCDLRWAYGAFKLLRNADGNGLSFASTSVRVEHPEKAPSSMYASSDAPSTVTVLVVNKSASPRRFGIRVSNSVALSKVDVRRIDAQSPDPKLVATDPLVKNNAYAYSAPALSATLLVFRQ